MVLADDCDVCSTRNNIIGYPQVGDRANADVPQYIGTFRMYLLVAADHNIESKGACLQL